MKNNYILFSLLIMATLFTNCKKSEADLKYVEGYIVGFDPCTINHHYRLGYVIISSDLNDTLLTYNLSDVRYKMPATVIHNLFDTLYVIPESYFQNYVNSAFFPGFARFDFPINVKYREATENEKIYLLCSSDINQSDLNNAIQIRIFSATK